MTEELKKLCEDIKLLIPPAIAESPTGEFESFIKGLKGKVNDEELDSINRAYNYFNRLLGTITGSSQIVSAMNPTLSQGPGPTLIQGQVISPVTTLSQGQGPMLSPGQGQGQDPIIVPTIPPVRETNSTIKAQSKALDENGKKIPTQGKTPSDEQQSEMIRLLVGVSDGLKDPKGKTT
jgi:hypothetical protein